MKETDDKNPIRKGYCYCHHVTVRLMSKQEIPKNNLLVIFSEVVSVYPRSSEITVLPIFFCLFAFIELTSIPLFYYIYIHSATRRHWNTIQWFNTNPLYTNHVSLPVLLKDQFLHLPTDLPTFLLHPQIPQRQNSSCKISASKTWFPYWFSL